MAMQELQASEIQEVSGAWWSDPSCFNGYFGGMVGGAIAGVPSGPYGVLFGGFGGLVGGAIAGGCFW